MQRLTLTVCEDRNTHERLGIHCFQQIVETVKEDAALTGTFIRGLTLSVRASNWVEDHFLKSSSYPVS